MRRDNLSLVRKSLLILGLVLAFALVPQSARADCGQAPGGSVTINSACSFAAPCSNTATAGCNYNGVDNGNITIGASGALTINAGQTIYFNPGQSVSITPGGYINIGKSGNTLGALSKGYLWVSGTVSALSSAAPVPTATNSSPGGGYIRRYTAPALYCPAAGTCPSACGYAGGTVAGGQDVNGNCLTTNCPATGSCCVPTYGQTCNCNACGTCGGTVPCGGGCSGSTPAVPTWYRDADADGYGNPSITLQQCSQPAGYVSNNTDCYDSNTNVHPGQTTCFTTNRGDGSYDYDCDGVQHACGAYGGACINHTTTCQVAWPANAYSGSPGYCSLATGCASYHGPLTGGVAYSTEYSPNQICGTLTSSCDYLGYTYINYHAGDPTCANAVSQLGTYNSNAGQFTMSCY